MSSIQLKEWIGRKEESADRIYPTPVRAFALTLNDRSFEPAEGAKLPELWHWLYFLPLVAMEEIGADGHPKRGGFLPPVTLGRRMWANGRYKFHHDLFVGEEIRKTSEITDIAEKTGRSGEMVFVTLRHLIHSDRGVAVEEQQEIVYIATPKKYAPPEPKSLPQDLEWKEPYPVGPVLLFRFSALSFNGHRIHYDWRYATELEKYPGILVHGPLQALLLLETAKRKHPGRRPASFAFRSIHPIFEFDDLSLCGREEPTGGCDLFTANREGHIGTEARVSWK